MHSTIVCKATLFLSGEKWEFPYFILQFTCTNPDVTTHTFPNSWRHSLDEYSRLQTFNFGTLKRPAFYYLSIFLKNQMKQCYICIFLLKKAPLLQKAINM